MPGPHHESPPAQPHDNAAELGAIIQQKRQAKGITAEQAAQAVPMRKAYIIAIESGQWRELPGGPYTRAYVRRYAEFLGLDSDYLLADYRQHEAPSQVRVWALSNRLKGQTHTPGPLAIAALSVAMVCMAGWSAAQDSAPISPVLAITTAPPIMHTLPARCATKAAAYPPCRWENLALWYAPMPYSPEPFAVESR